MFKSKFDYYYHIHEKTCKKFGRKLSIMYTNKIFLQALWDVKAKNVLNNTFYNRVFAQLTFLTIDAMLK